VVIDWKIEQVVMFLHHPTPAAFVVHVQQEILVDA
jgi:hypothetical protein